MSIRAAVLILSALAASLLGACSGDVISSGGGGDAAAPLDAGHCGLGLGEADCAAYCCHADPCEEAEVAVECTVSSPASCTCVAGTNEGKQYTLANGADACNVVDMWNQCNL